MTAGNLTRLVEELAASGVEFLLVGGLAAVAQGAPLATFDVDIVPRRVEANIDRLMSFLLKLNAQTVQVLGLRRIVELKRSSSHPKDQRAIPVLEETLRRSGDSNDNDQ